MSTVALRRPTDAPARLAAFESCACTPTPKGRTLVSFVWAYAGNRPTRAATRPVSVRRPGSEFVVAYDPPTSSLPDLSIGAPETGFGNRHPSVPVSSPFRRMSRLPPERRLSTVRALRLRRVTRRVPIGTCQAIRCNRNRNSGTLRQALTDRCFVLPVLRREQRARSALASFGHLPAWRTACGSALPGGARFRWSFDPRRLYLMLPRDSVASRNRAVRHWDYNISRGCHGQ